MEHNNIDAVEDEKRSWVKPETYSSASFDFDMANAETNMEEADFSQPTDIQEEHNQ
jgi:hypothetical protein